MAAGLAAEIQDKFGVRAELAEGYNGIYEVRMNESIISTNQGSCGGIKPPEEILWQIRQYLDPLPGKKIARPLALGFK